MFESLFADYDTNTVIITPTYRLSRQIHEAYAQYQQAQGKQAWLTPDICALAQWLDDVWLTAITCLDSTEALPMRLSTWQVQVIWEQIVSQSTIGESLLNVRETAKLLMQAWRLQQDWCLDSKELARYPNDDCKIFCQLAKDYSDACQAKHAIDDACLVHQLALLADSGQLQYKRHLQFVGFEEIAPSLRRLLTCLQALGSDIRECVAAEQASDVTCVVFERPCDEWYAAARFAKHCLDNDANAQIGIIVPQLSQQFAAIEAVFSEVFVPQSCFAEHAHLERPFNMSSGHRLEAQPVIYRAFEILSLGIGEQPLAQIKALLQTPFIGGSESEWMARAAFIQELSNYQLSSMTLAQCIAILPDCLVQLKQHLEALAQVLDSIPRRALPSRWASVFSECLLQMGWPGERELSSSEYQAVQHWHTLLQQMASLDVVSEPLFYQQALAQCRAQGKVELFQVQTQNKPIQILGALEAGGLQFDHTWVMGLTDDVWPSAPSPNPFIPMAVQRQWQIPHATPERELQFASGLMKKFFQASAKVWVSYAKYHTSGALEAQPSGLLVGIPCCDGLKKVNEWAKLTPSFYQQLWDTHQLERLYDHSVRPYAHKQLPGGASLLKAQAACPFQAFVRYRLQAQDLPEPVLGFSVKQRGESVHLALQQIWRRLGSLAQLRALGQAQLKDLVKQAVDHAVETLLQSGHHQVGPRFAALEKKRLCALIMEFLVLERKRADFHVLQTEAMQTITLAGHTLSLRLDRLDQVSDGGALVIDYKTGTTALNDWLGERIKEPQLPLYAISLNRPLMGLAFAEVRANEQGFKGVTCKRDVIPGVKSFEQESERMGAKSWEALRADWQRRLTSLVDEFSHGHALVAPRDGDATCRYCDFGMICRINVQ